MKKYTMFLLISLFLIANICFADNQDNGIYTNGMVESKDQNILIGTISVPTSWPKFTRFDPKPVDCGIVEVEKRGFFIYYITYYKDENFDEGFVENLCVKVCERFLKDPLQAALRFETYDSSKEYENYIVDYNAGAMNVSCYVSSPSEDTVLFLATIDVMGSMQRDFVRIIDSFQPVIRYSLQAEDFLNVLDTTDNYLTQYADLFESLIGERVHRSELIELEKSLGTVITEFARTHSMSIRGDIDETRKKETLSNITETLHRIADDWSEY